MDSIIVITAIIHIAAIAYLLRYYKAARRDSMEEGISSNHKSII